jgi:5-methylcytosine-specific restriction endonuclease McrA
MSEDDDFFALRPCLPAPGAEHEMAADLLSAAADALLKQNLDEARALLGQADLPELLKFANRVMGPIDRLIHRPRRLTQPIERRAKVKARMPSATASFAVYQRDGWRCRFCGCRVISPRARDFVRARIPGAVMWGENKRYHSAFYALTATIDHVVPHSAGGDNEPENLVTACWPCQFGRGDYSLEEFGLLDPRLRPPIVDGWDGLSRMVPRSPVKLAAGPQPLPIVAVRAPANGGLAPQPAGPRKACSAPEVEWLTRLDPIQPMDSRRLVELLNACDDFAVTWRINKVLIARIAVGTDWINVMGIEPDGSLQIPWFVGEHKKQFRSFAETLAAGIPGAVAYETPKMWRVAKPGKQRLHVLELLDHPTAFRAALEVLHTALRVAL